MKEEGAEPRAAKLMEGGAEPRATKMMVEGDASRAATMEEARAELRATEIEVEGVEPEEQGLRWRARRHNLVEDGQSPEDVRMRGQRLAKRRRRRREG